MINFDQNATTPVHPEVLDELVHATREFSGNSSSGHSLGLKAAKYLDDCRARVAKILNAAHEREIVFTSGGTESDNAAVRGIAWAMRRKGGGTQIITSSIEHRAVLAPCEWLQKQGFELRIVGVDRNGGLDLHEYMDALNHNTVLVSVMYANNEIGTVQPLPEIVKLAKEKGAMVHSDAVQAAGKLKIDVVELGVDSISLSAHKFYGPKGVGVLYLKEGTPYATYMLGGTHENDKRAGTVAVPQIGALTKALEIADLKRVEQGESLRVLRDDLVKRLISAIPGAHLNGDLSRSTLNTASIRFDGIRGARLLKRMDEEGVLASSGSACLWEETRPSHVLTAIGLSDEEGRGTIRFSLGYGNTAADVEQVAATLAKLVPELRKQEATA